MATRTSHRQLETFENGIARLNRALRCCQMIGRDVDPDTYAHIAPMLALIARELEAAKAEKIKAMNGKG